MTVVAPAAGAGVPGYGGYRLLEGIWFCVIAAEEWRSLILWVIAVACGMHFRLSS